MSNNECFHALSKFPNGKTPGNDGLTPEFYKKFWNLLGHLLTDSLNCSYLHGELSNSQKQAIIRLIEKKGKDRRYIKNWRPISLLNVDTKIASKALALRLDLCLAVVISYTDPSQAEKSFGSKWPNRLFPSSLVPLFQSESKCETILMKMTLICTRMELHAELIFM